LVGFNKSFNGAVVGFFYIGRKKAGGKLTRISMITYAFTANPLSAAGFACAREGIGAITSCFIFNNLAFFHLISLLYAQLHNFANNFDL
jgi:hypothetical protein